MPNSIRTASALRRLRAARVLPGRRSSLQQMRVRLPDGARTTIHVAAYEVSAHAVRLVALERPMPLVRWCANENVRHAVVGSFFVPGQYLPLGELRIGGEPHPSAPFDAPWGEIRACVQIVDGHVRISRRDQIGAQGAGDLLQAGPLLVAAGRRVVAKGEDTEGFSAGSRQFDSDITQGRYPRAALGIAGERLLAVACDGRTRRDAGMTLVELAETLVELGATDALNLDGGGSASLVCDGRLRNRPREEHGVDLLDGRPVATAIVFAPR